MAREQDESYQLLVGISKGTVFRSRNFAYTVSTAPRGNPEPGMQYSVRMEFVQFHSSSLSSTANFKNQSTCVY